MSKVSGKVKWFNEKKGYGFIEKASGGDVFVHFKDINTTGFKTLTENQEVTFEVIQDRKGEKATNVTTK